MIADYAHLKFQNTIFHTQQDSLISIALVASLLEFIFKPWRGWLVTISNIWVHL